VFKIFKFSSFKWFFLYSAGCLARFEAFVPVASLPPSAVTLAPWSLCLVGVSFPYCCSLLIGCFMAYSLTLKIEEVSSS
jgi:hypothetical protein